MMMRCMKKAVMIITIIMVTTSFVSCRRQQGFGAGADIFERMANTTYEVKLLFPGMDPQPDRDMVVQAINDKLTEMGYPGLTIRLDSMDWASWSGRSTAIILSGGDYDLAYAPDWAPFYNDALMGGAWLPWESYIIPEYAEWIEPWREYLYVWGANHRQKHIYRVPTIKEYATYPLEVRWNKNVTDRLGITEAMRAVTSVYDLEPFLELYKNEYENRGMAVIAVDSGDLINYFALGAPGIFQPVYTADTDSYVNAAFSPWFDEYVNLLRDWYAKGYIPDYQQLELLDDLILKFGTESFLVYFNRGKPGGEAELNQVAMQQYGFEWGVTVLTPPYIDLNALLAVSWGLNSRSRNPEAAAFVYQLLSTSKELTNLINFGIEGVHYNLDDNGVAIRVEPSRYFSNLLWMLGNRFLCHRLPGEPENLSELYMDFNNRAIRFPNFGFPYPGDDAWDGVNVDMFWGTAAALNTQYQRSIMIGNISDAEIADIRLKLTQSNFQGIDEVMNREYRTWQADR